MTWCENNGRDYMTAKSEPPLEATGSTSRRVRDNIRHSSHDVNEFIDNDGTRCYDPGNSRQDRLPVCHHTISNGGMS
jgi:hypothetical protein